MNIRKDWGACRVTDCPGRDEYRTAALCRLHYNRRRSCQKNHAGGCTCWDAYAENPTHCTHADCRAPIRCKGLCALHYDRLINGVPLDDPEQKYCPCGDSIAIHNRTGLCFGCYQKQWLTPERQAARNYRRRTRIQAGQRPPATAKEIARIRRQPCVYCGTEGPSTVDHVIPLSRGGDNAVGNLAPACADCNRRKHMKFVIEWRATRPGPAASARPLATR